MKAVLPLLAALGLAGPAFAQAAFDLEAAVESCAACHGEDGLPIDPGYPIIWGQQYFYIYTQLKDYAAERRLNETMSPMAAQYSRDEMKAIAEHFAEQPWPAIEAHSRDGDEAISESAISSGQCSACHGKWGGDSRIPRLAGQQPGYLAQTMRDFKNDVRLNAPDKTSTMAKLSDDTIDALSRYLSSLTNVTQ